MNFTPYSELKSGANELPMDAKSARDRIKTIIENCDRKTRDIHMTQLRPGNPYASLVTK